MSNRNIASPHAPPRIIISAPRGSESESSRSSSIRRITSQSSLGTESSASSKSTDRMHRPNSSKPPLSASNSIESIPTRVIHLSRSTSSQSSNADESESSAPSSSSNRSNRKVGSQQKESRASSRASETTESASESTHSRKSSNASASTITPRTSKSTNASSATPRASDTTYTSSSTVSTALSNVPLPPKYKRSRQNTATLRKNDSSDSIIFSSSESNASKSTTSASHSSTSTGSDDSRSHSRSKKHSLYIDTRRDHLRELLELPPLPSTPVPKGRPAADSKKKAKLKIISPTTGAFVTVADTDLLLPATLPHSPEVASPQHPDTDPDHTAFEIMDTEQMEKKQESERIRALLKNSAALAGGRGRTRSSSPARRDTMFSGGGATDYGDGHARKQPVFAKSAENEVGPVFESGDPDILFVDDGGKFRHLKRIRMGETDKDEDDVSFEDQLQRLCVTINASSSHLLSTAHGIYAGLCLLSLALFPSTEIPVFTPTTSTYTTVLQFVAFYSQVSTPTSRLFSVVGTLAVLATLDGGYDPAVGDGMDRVSRWWSRTGKHLSGVGAIRWWRRRSGRWKRIAGALAILFTVVSYVCTIIMVPVDDKLYESQRGQFGGPYGGKDW
ncbi:hypothetical protein CcCBS67573_g08854 [Chytriomyces confervae]|uniref:Uncharacterized protein n=1 Tax=Chytriomyces confervae TaxID=246404 RepID=A0A507EG58_9FUNG|nr:hypothetical protein CcCBS67573_g08854 [Chytriomyces confervae]